MKVTFRPSKSYKPTEDQGFNVGYGAVKRTGYAIRWYFIVFVIVSPILGFTWYGASKTLLVTATGILTSEPLNLKAIEAGTVRSVSVKPGQYVQVGQHILTIDSPVLTGREKLLQKSITLLQKDNSTAQARYLELGQQKINTTHANLSTQMEFDVQHKAYKDKGIIPLSDQIQLQIAQTDARLMLLNARQEYHTGKGRFLSGPSAQGILSLVQELNQIESRIQQLKIESPHAAVINDLFVQNGEYVSAGQEVASISSRVAPVVIAYINPSDMDYSVIGQTATVTFPNNDTFNAIIEEPTHLADKIPAALASPFDGTKSALKVILTLQEPIDKMIEGLPVHIRFHYLGQYDAFTQKWLSWVPFLSPSKN
jgi:multidrug resistance efflux pump